MKKLSIALLFLALAGTATPVSQEKKEVRVARIQTFEKRYQSLFKKLPNKKIWTRAVPGCCGGDADCCDD